MRNYFYKVPYGNTGRNHWLFGKFETKNAVIAATEGKAFEILTVKQLFDKHSEDEVRSIARNCLIYQPAVLGEFPDDVAKLLK